MTGLASRKTINEAAPPPPGLAPWPGGIHRGDVPQPASPLLLRCAGRRSQHRFPPACGVRGRWCAGLPRWIPSSSRTDRVGLVPRPAERSPVPVPGEAEGCWFGQWSGDPRPTKQIRNESSRDQRAVKTNFAACQPRTTVCETASEAARWAPPTEMRRWAVPTPRESRWNSVCELVPRVGNFDASWCWSYIVSGAILPGYSFDVLPETTAHARIAP